MGTWRGEEKMSEIRLPIAPPFVITQPNELTPPGLCEEVFVLQQRLEYGRGSAFVLGPCGEDVEAGVHKDDR